MKTAYLYCDSRSLNDATKYYIGIIKDALHLNGYSFKTTFYLYNLKHADIILTITGKYFLQAKLRYPFKKTIYWAQGISEESKMSGQCNLIYQIKSFAEKTAVRRSTLLILVSERMKTHFSEKYKYMGDNYFIMPCFNKELYPQWDLKQFASPKFVYAGSASIWQASEQMLDTYAQVEQSIPNASLTILSNQKEIFEKKINERGIKNYTIKYVSLDNLDAELLKYKYGFLLRENHIVNNVATPTKMNSYLASHLIPIYSTAVQDFNDNIDLGEFTIKVPTPLIPSKIAKTIIKFETEDKDFSHYSNVVSSLFKSHYNRDKYIKDLKIKLSSLHI